MGGGEVGEVGGEVGGGGGEITPAFDERLKHRRSSDASVKLKRRVGYFLVERLPAPFFGGPLPLRFSRSALLCQYLQQRWEGAATAPESRFKWRGLGEGRVPTLARGRGTARPPSAASCTCTSNQTVTISL